MKRRTGADIRRFLGGLLTECEVYAPVEHDRIVTFEAIGSGDEVLLDYGNSRISPRHVLLPRMETLLTSCAGDRCASECKCSSRPIVLFGTRPCDARAFLLLDEVFCGGKTRDVYYGDRRDLLTIVSIGCRQPLEACFCVTTGGGPMSTEGSDILLEETGDGYEVHPVTGRGKGFASAHGLLDPPGGGERTEAADRRPWPAIEPTVDLGALKAALDGSFEDPRWLALTEKCLGCGVCSFLCPSCHCFDIVDEEAGGVCTRKRVWDSCQFSCFTEQASGFNPRPTGRERYRQRIMHKFSYCMENYGRPGCVGCGRCVAECPVNLDIRQILVAFGGPGGN